MSRDQKPGRIRVVSSGRAPRPEAPAAETQAGDESAPDGAPSSAADDSPARPRAWTGALIFIGGCAVGGAGVTALLRGL